MKDTTYEKVKKYMVSHGMIAPGDCVVAGVSGGADSVCMLHLLRQFQKEVPFRLAVVHVNHGLRAEAGEDAAFVEALCGQWGLPFFLREVDMPGYAVRHKISSEEAGRLLRYRAFAEVLRELNAEDRGKIAVAHNAEDRAETMLFHMFRGSGLKGLGSIRPVRESVIRPLLAVSRAEIESYLVACGLTYREDRTNGEDAYARNRIRHHILPFAQREISGGAVSHMGELADILAETEDYLERETGRLYDRYVTETGEAGAEIPEAEAFPGGTARGQGKTALEIDLAGLGAEDAVMIKRVFLHALERIAPHRKDITARHIKSLLDLMEKEGSKEISLPHDIRACKEYETLFLRRDAAESGKGGRGEKAPPSEETAYADAKAEIAVGDALGSPGVPVEITLSGVGDFTFLLWESDSLPETSLFYRKEQNIPENRYTKWFDYDKITTSLLLRTRREGDYLAIDEALHTQSVKRYMINEKIPKMQRDSMYVLADGSHVLWIPGYRVSSQYMVGESTRRILEVRLRGGNDGGTNRGIVDGGAS